MGSIYIVDAFTDRPFAGNPAAIMPLTGPIDEVRMASIAMEMNQAETAFFWPEGNCYRLRWFTPTTEVDLCGHATLATAHVLWNHLGKDGPLSFSTQSGELRANRDEKAIWLDFPAIDVVEDSKVNSQYLQAMWTGRSSMDWIFAFDNESKVRSYQPDLASIQNLGMRGLIITAPGTESGYDFVSRCFYPQTGIDEDAVTGSAHCALAPFWAKRLGKPELIAYQASRRGGILALRCCDDRVLLGGSAVTTLVGELSV